jgi:hypothetical protein
MNGFVRRESGFMSVIVTQRVPPAALPIST